MHRTFVCLTILTALTACDDHGSRPESVPVAPPPPGTDPAGVFPMIGPAEVFTNAAANQSRPFRPFKVDGRRATVMLFLMHDCPVGNATAPEMARLAAEFAPRGVHFFGVYATETAAEVATHLRDYGLPFPGILDPKLIFARFAGATRAPEAAVFSSSNSLLYRGRIDDRAVRPGITRPAPQRNDLRLALEAVLDGREPDPRFTDAVGCHLPLE
jgi:Redoxin